MARDLKPTCIPPHPKACHRDLAHLIAATKVVFEMPLTLYYSTGLKSDQALKIPATQHAKQPQIEEITKSLTIKQMFFQTEDRYTSVPGSCV